MLVERCLAMAREAPEDPYAGLAPRELLQRGDLPVARQRTIGREPDPAELRARALEAETSGACRRGRHQFERRRGERLGDRPSRSRPRAAFRAPIGSTGHSCSASVIAGEGATMQRDHAWHSARHLDDLDDAGGHRPARRRARGRAAQRRRGRSPANIRCCSIRASRRPCSAISPARSAARRSRARRASSRTSSASRVFAPGVTIVDDPLRRARPALAPVRRRGRARVAAGAGRRTACSTAGSPKALRRGSSASQPTGHAARGVGGAPGASPSNLYMAAGTAQPRRSCSRLFPKRCWSSS